MAQYTYVLEDLTSGTIKDEIPLRSVEYGQVLNAPGAFNGSIDRRHPKATRANLDPNSTALYVMRYDACVWGGIVRTIRSNGDGLNIGAEGFWSYFRNRRLRHTKNFSTSLGGTDADPLAIVRDLIDYAQDPAYSPGGDIGVQTGSELIGSTTGRVWYGYERRNIGTIIEALSDNALSFDFAIEAEYNAATNSFEKTLVLSAPKRGRRTGLVWEIGKHCDLSEYLLDGTRQANQIDGIGAGDGDAMVLAQASDTNQLPPNGPYPLLEDAFIAKDIAVPEHLAELCNTRLERRKYPVAVPNIFLRDTEDTRIGSFITGDEVRLLGGDGFTSFDNFFRIDSWTTDVSDEGAERTKVEFVEAGLLTEESPA